MQTKVAISCQKQPKAAKSRQKQPKVVKTSEKQSKVAKILLSSFLIFYLTTNLLSYFSYFFYFYTFILSTVNYPETVQRHQSSIISHWIDCLPLVQAGSARHPYDHRQTDENRHCHGHSCRAPPLDWPKKTTNIKVYVLGF